MLYIWLLIWLIIWLILWYIIWKKNVNLALMKFVYIEKFVWIIVVIVWAYMNVEQIPVTQTFDYVSAGILFHLMGLDLWNLLTKYRK